MATQRRGHHRFDNQLSASTPALRSVDPYAVAFGRYSHGLRENQPSMRGSARIDGGYHGSGGPQDRSNAMHLNGS